MRDAVFSSAIGDWSAPLPHPRFSVYRNNVISALIQALRVRHPVTEELVGRAFFAAMAGEFADGLRPASPVLIEYGGEFPDFIAKFNPAASVPYLGDLAKFESLWWQAYHAADAKPLAPGELAARPAELWGVTRFSFVPSTFIQDSRHAVHSIWLAHRGGRPMHSFETANAERVLIARPKGSVEVHGLSVASFGLLSALMAGRTLGEAISLSPVLDLQAELQRLVSFNIISGLHP